MKQIILFAIITIFVGTICLFDSSPLRADDPEDPDNVELAIPPMSPDAEKESDGITIINYAPDDPESDSEDEVTGSNDDGKNNKLAGLQPDQVVKVTVRLGANRAGRVFQVAALDGGEISEIQDGAAMADEEGTIRFAFQAGHEPGLYQVALNDGTREIGVHFWVVNNASPDENPVVDLPESGAESIGGTEGPTPTPPANNNPTGPCGAFNGFIQTGCAIDPFTANATRSVTDLGPVPGATGMYPLAFTRTLNTRYVSGPVNEFGTAGNWRHSYQWSIDSVEVASGYPTSYFVNYPDGRRVQFNPAPSPSPSPVDPYFRGPTGVLDRFQQLRNDIGFSTSECYLVLPDGGRVHFHASQTNGQFTFNLVEIIDPYKQSQLISYSDAANRPCMIVEEPAHRQLKIFYRFIPLPSGGQVKVVTRAEWWSAPSELGGVRVQAVYYYYSPSGALSSVNYPDGTTATYTYQTSNLPSESARPLIRTCVDPMFGGPMWKIGYSFVQGGVYGWLQSENYFDGTNIGPAVSSLNIPSTSTRQEIRGDGPTRTCTYTGYQLTAATDFKNISSYLTYDYWTGRGFLVSITDRNDNYTGYGNDPWTGNVTTTTFDEDNGAPASTTDWGGTGCNDSHNADPNNRYYVFATINGKKPGRRSHHKYRGYNAEYYRDDHKRVETAYYPSHVHPDRETETFDYNDFGQVREHRMRNGGTERFVYDDRGLLKEYYDAMHVPEGMQKDDPSQFTGPSVAYTYYDSGPSMDRVLSIKDAFEHETIFTYNERGQVLTKHSPGAANAVINHYNGDGTLADVTDELGHTTNYTYDYYRRLCTTRLPAPTPGAARSTTTFCYDPACGPSPQSSGTSSYTHTDANPTLVTSPTGKMVKTAYDANFLKSSVTVGYGTSDASTRTFTYDNNGNQATVTDFRNGAAVTENTTAYGYDRDNRVVWMDDPMVNASPVPHKDSITGHTVKYTYNEAGYAETITRANGQTITNTHNSTFPERLESTTVRRDDVGGNNAQTIYRYYTPSGSDAGPPGSIGLLKYMQDPLLREKGSSQKYTYSYDLMGRKTNLEYPAVSGSGTTRKNESWSYDTAGNLATFTNRTGDIQTFDIYDVRNRLRHFYWSNDVASELWIYYDDASRVREITNANATIINDYFNDNTLHTQTETIAGEQVPRTVTYGYNADLNRNSISYPNSHAFTYSHTNRSQVAAIQDTTVLHSVAAYAYDLSGNVIGSTVGGVVTNANLQYNPLNMCTYISRNFVGESNARTFAYQYDAVNNRTQITRDGATKLYTYDLADQLRDATGEATFNYDNNGNLKGGYCDIEDPQVQCFATNLLNQYIRFNSISANITYDTKGNLMTYDGWSYSYDAQNRMTQATNGSTTEKFKYDGLNRQISHTFGTGANSVTTYNVWDGWKLIEEWTRVGTGGANLTYSYVYGARGEILERINASGERRLYFQDALGNTSHVANQTGQLLEYYKYNRTGEPTFYSADGSLANPAVNDIRHLFHGRLWTNETGLYDYRARMELPTMGIFMQPDPISFSGDPTNLYRFCGNNALNLLIHGAYRQRCRCQQLVVICNYSTRWKT